MYSGVSPSLRLHRQRPQALLPQQSLYETTYIRPSSGLWQVPTQVIADISVPGGQLLVEPPQQPHRKPSIPQWRQYSQAFGSFAFGDLPSGVGFSAAEAPRAMGSRGSTDAPINIDPSEPRKLRRDVRRAIARADPSVNASNQLMDCLRTHDHAARCRSSRYSCRDATPSFFASNKLSRCSRELMIPRVRSTPRSSRSTAYGRRLIWYAIPRADEMT